MKPVDCFKTCDGVIHPTLAAAKRHAEKRYAELLLTLTHRLHQINKHTDKAEFINTHAEDFARLCALKNDIDLDKNDEEYTDE